MGQTKDQATSNLKEILDQSYTVDELRKIAKYCKISNCNRKDEFLKAIEKYIQKNIHEIYASLDNTSKTAVQETIYNYAGTFDVEKFHSKYGRLPVNIRASYNYSLKLVDELTLIFHRGVIPIDLRNELKNNIPKPTEFTIESFKELKDKIELVHKKWDDSKTIDARKLIIRQTEIEALHNSQTVFSLIQSGKIKGSSKTGMISEASQEIISKHLFQGDFYTEKENAKEKGDLVIQPFSIPLILHNANMVKYDGSKLELSSKGLKWIGSKPEDFLKECWERWLVSSYDEFNRINSIKGQKSNVARNAKDRRNSILFALQKLPLDEWVSVTEISKFMKIKNIKFHVANDLWKLYIEDREHGNLGYEGFGTWEIVEERYMLVFLFEYVATLGILDIAYINPTNARDDFHNNWGTDDLPYLSRYDGLIYIKINPLGKYLLGITDKYISKVTESEKNLKLLANLEIVSTNHLNQSDTLFLESIAKKTADHVYKIDELLVLNLLEKGRTSFQIIDFLTQKSDLPLPNIFTDFFDKISRKSGLFKNLGNGKLLQVVDKPTALLISKDKKLKELCYFSEPNLIFILSKNEKEFFKTLKLMGYVISKEILM